MNSEAAHQEPTMDKGYARAYIHPASIGDSQACSAFIAATKAAIAQLYAGGIVEGYQMLLVEDAAIAADESATGDALHHLTKGRFPYVYIRLQPVDQPPLDIDRAMGEWECTRVD
jgi:hypothetical protein